MTEERWYRSEDRLPLMILQILQSLPDLTKPKGTEMKTFLEAADIDPDTTWTKGSRSGSAGQCVELAALDGGVALRHSKDEGRGALVFTKDEMSAFVQGAKDGEFDHLI